MSIYIEGTYPRKIDSDLRIVIQHDEFWFVWDDPTEGTQQEWVDSEIGNKLMKLYGWDEVDYVTEPHA